MFNLSGYSIRQKIYESHLSFVFRGFRTECGTPVVLKVLEGDYPPAVELARYQKEYDLLSGLSIPGVIKTLDLFKHRNTLVLCLEDLVGTILVDQCH